ncbi:IBR domain protein [Aspergillus affinis]|uniref:IBR domain protein n=1 Tax=Aspergillus affinis TaxID=1070780 RepID=UPI0022FEBB52|nr:IBR domain protein [Aspergillus affinis]KAI9046193.1 IBR domain protein [Aspergillus affinis]
MDNVGMSTTPAFTSEASEKTFDESHNKLKFDRNPQQNAHENIDRSYSDPEDESNTKRLTTVNLQKKDFAVQRPGPELGAECIACTETVPDADIVTVPCSHRYCRTCITQIFEDGLKAGASWPPHCCEILIPVPHVHSYIGSILSQQAVQKNAEDADRKRTCCAGEDCGLYVPPQFRKDKTRQCTKCKTKTCTTCKRLAHRGKCHPDGLLRKLARKKGWRRCQSCGHMIERSGGCSDMTYVRDHSFACELKVDCH